MEALLLTEAPLARDALLLSEAEELTDPRRPFLSGVLLVLEAPEGEADGDLDTCRGCRPPPDALLPLPAPDAAEDGLAGAALGRGLRALTGAPCWCSIWLTSFWAHLQEGRE